MYAATGGENMKWGSIDFKWGGGRAPLAPPLATALNTQVRKEILESLFDDVWICCKRWQVPWSILSKKLPARESSRAW